GTALLAELVVGGPAGQVGVVGRGEDVVQRVGREAGEQVVGDPEQEEGRQEQRKHSPAHGGRPPARATTCRGTPKTPGAGGPIPGPRGACKAERRLTTLPGPRSPRPPGPPPPPRSCRPGRRPRPGPCRPASGRPSAPARWSRPRSGPSRPRCRSGG